MQWSKLKKNNSTLNRLKDDREQNQWTVNLKMDQYNLFNLNKTENRLKKWSKWSVKE